MARLICDSRMASKLYSSNGVGAATVALILAATDNSLREAFATTRLLRVPWTGMARQTGVVRPTVAGRADRPLAALIVIMLRDRDLRRGDDAAACVGDDKAA